MLRKGQIQRQFSDETDGSRNLGQPADDSLYEAPKERHPAGELDGMEDAIKNVVKKASRDFRHKQHPGASIGERVDHLIKNWTIFEDPEERKMYYFEEDLDPAEEEAIEDIVSKYIPEEMDEI